MQFRNNNTKQDKPQTTSGLYTMRVSATGNAESDIDSLLSTQHRSRSTNARLSVSELCDTRSRELSCELLCADDNSANSACVYTPTVLDTLVSDATAQANAATEDTAQANNTHSASVSNDNNSASNDDTDSVSAVRDSTNTPTQQEADYAVVSSERSQPLDIMNVRSVVDNNAERLMTIQLMVDNTQTQKDTTESVAPKAHIDTETSGSHTLSDRVHAEDTRLYVISAPQDSGACPQSVSLFTQPVLVLGTACTSTQNILLRKRRSEDVTHEDKSKKMRTLYSTRAHEPTILPLPLMSSSASKANTSTKASTSRTILSESLQDSKMRYVQSAKKKISNRLSSTQKLNIFRFKKMNSVPQYINQLYSVALAPSYMSPHDANVHNDVLEYSASIESYIRSDKSLTAYHDACLSVIATYILDEEKMCELDVQYESLTLKRIAIQDDDTHTIYRFLSQSTRAGIDISFCERKIHAVSLSDAYITYITTIISGETARLFAMNIYADDDIIKAALRKKKAGYTLCYGQDCSEHNDGYIRYILRDCQDTYIHAIFNQYTKYHSLAMPIDKLMDRIGYSGYTMTLEKLESIIYESFVTNHLIAHCHITSCFMCERLDYFRDSVALCSDAALQQDNTQLVPPNMLMHLKRIYLASLLDHISESNYRILARHDQNDTQAEQNYIQAIKTIKTGMICAYLYFLANCADREKETYISEVNNSIQELRGYMRHIEHMPTHISTQDIQLTTSHQRVVFASIDVAISNAFKRYVNCLNVVIISVIPAIVLLMNTLRCEDNMNTIISHVIVRSNKYANTVLQQMRSLAIRYLCMPQNSRSIPACMFCRYDALRGSINEVHNDSPLELQHPDEKCAIKKIIIETLKALRSLVSDATVTSEEETRAVALFNLYEDYTNIHTKREKFQAYIFEFLLNSYGTTICDLRKRKSAKNSTMHPMSACFSKFMVSLQQKI